MVALISAPLQDECFRSSRDCLIAQDALALLPIAGALERERQYPIGHRTQCLPYRSPHLPVLRAVQRAAQRDPHRCLFREVAFFCFHAATLLFCSTVRCGMAISSRSKTACLSSLMGIQSSSST